MRNFLIILLFALAVKQLETETKPAKKKSSAPQLLYEYRYWYLRVSAVPHSSWPGIPTTSSFRLRLYFSGILATCRKYRNVKLCNFLSAGGWGHFVRYRYSAVCRN